MAGVLFTCVAATVACWALWTGIRALLEADAT